MTTKRLGMAEATIRLDSSLTVDGRRSLKIRIGYRKDRRRYAFPRPIILTQTDYVRLVNYHKTKSERISEEIRLLYKHEVKPFIDKAEQVLSQLTSFDFETFREYLYRQEGDDKEEEDQTDLIAALYKKAETMRKADRLGNAVNYELAGKSLQRFIDSFNREELSEFLGIRLRGKTEMTQPRVLRFEQLTEDFLNLYEQWMLSEGKKSQIKEGRPKGASITTVGIYLRHVRAVFNDAINSGIVERTHYPFKLKEKMGYVIPAGTNIKKALPKEDIVKIASFECEPGSYQQRSRDFWVFSYLCNGMNFKDMLMLKWSDYDQYTEEITFVREKTLRTKKGNQAKVHVYVHPFAKEVIQRWGTEGIYIFPVLNESMTTADKKKAIAQCIQVTNKHMRQIGDQLGIKGDLRTYAARHSYASNLMLSNAPLAFIKESLGHSSLQTTDAYLKSFKGEVARKYSKNLL